MSQDCSRCGKRIQDPVERNANYIVSDDFSEREEKDVFVAFFHTDETKQQLDKIDEEFPERNRQSLAAEAAAEDADVTKKKHIGQRKRLLNPESDLSEDQITKLDKNPLQDDEVYVEELPDVDADDVTYGEIDTTEDVHFSIDSDKFEKRIVETPRGFGPDDSVARVESDSVEVTTQKTGVICPSCLKDDDEIIWGIDG